MLVLPALLLLVWALQVRIDRFRPSRPEPESFLLYLPSGKYLKPITLGYRELAADLLWMKTIDYFGGHYGSDKKYTWLYHMLELVTTLDPRFAAPFHFGSVVLLVEARENENAEKLLRKAMKFHPNVWQFPFYMGFNFYFNERNYKEAAAYFDRASRLPGAPGYLRPLAARLYATSGDVSTGLSILKELYFNTKDENVKKEILKRMEVLKRER